MTDFLDSRLTERRNPRTATIDVASPAEIVALLNAEDRLVPDAVAQAAPELARAIELVEAAFRAGRRLVYVGAGTSGRLGVLDAAECPPTFGSEPGMVTGLIAGGEAALVRAIEGAEDDTGAGRDAIDAQAVAPGDVVAGIAASGTTPYVGAALARARERGARTLLVTCTDPPEALRAACDVCIVVKVGPEALTGSTRLKAGTATKLVLNTLTTGAMIRLGKAYGNLMVDLRASNAKLVDRSERILMEAAGLDRAGARRVLDAAGGQVKLAIVMARLGLPRDEAARRLAGHGGHLRPLVGDPPPVHGA